MTRQRKEIERFKRSFGYKNKINTTIKSNINSNIVIQKNSRSSNIKNKTLFISGSCCGISGYDNLVYETIKGIRSAGVDIRINAENIINYNYCPDWFREIHQPLNRNCNNLIITPPCNLPGMRIDKNSAILTMWETDTLDKIWVDAINSAKFCCVPSKWGVETFKKSGVKIPIYLTPLGYDPLIFYPKLEKPKICTFGSAAALSAGGLRKNIGYVINLFKTTFPNEKDVKLEIKVSPNCQLEHVEDERIKIIREILPPKELTKWYHNITTFINLSYAEGFGLHLIESMACGTPVISSNYSAVNDYLNEDNGFILDYELIQAKGGAYRGLWAKSNEITLKNIMKDIYNNKYDIEEKSSYAIQTSKHYKWKDFGFKLMNSFKLQNMEIL